MNSTNTTPPTLRELLAGATPGPWQERFIYRLFVATRANPDYKLNAPRETDWPTAQLIARCDPATMGAVLETLEEARTVILREYGESGITFKINRTIDLLNGTTEAK
jgi:hypothetical protein